MTTLKGQAEQAGASARRPMIMNPTGGPRLNSEEMKKYTTIRALPGIPENRYHSREVQASSVGIPVTDVMNASPVISAVSQRIISPILARLNARARWWPLGVFNLRSDPPLRALIIGGKRVALQFPAGEFSEQQWEFRHLYFDDPYGLKGLPPDICTVLDIGGNIGFFSLLARHYFPAAIIHCYEPNPMLLPMITENTRGLEIVVHPAGVAAANSTAAMNCEGVTLGGTLHPTEFGDIKVIAMRDAMDRLGGIVDLVKMDCEGGEWSILEEGDCLHRIKYLAMEYHLSHARGRTVDGLVRHLKAHGFFIDSLRESDNRVVGQLTASNSYVVPRG